MILMLRINVLPALGAMPMTSPLSESENEPLRLDFDHRLTLDFHVSMIQCANAASDCSHGCGDG
jgi:hypothetical protein